MIISKFLSSYVVPTVLFFGMVFIISFVDNALVGDPDVTKSGRFFVSLVLDFILILISGLWMLSLVYPKISGYLNKAHRFYLQTVFVVLFLSILYLSYYKSRADALYAHIQQRDSGLTSNLIAYDSLLGFKYVSNGAGFEYGQFGKRNAVFLDSNGFRIDQQSRDIRIGRDSILFIGCSFTFGSACSGDETFAHLVGEAANINAINAGASSYGLAQIYLRVKELIPRYQPKYCVVQYSPWLVKRATRPFGMNRYFPLPVPFFSLSKGEVVLNRPIFKSPYFQLKMTGDTIDAPGVFKKLTFHYKVGLPLLFCGDLSFFRKKPSSLLIDSSDYELIERTIYNEIRDICESNNTQFILLPLGDKEYTKNYIRLFDSTPSIANADSLLWSQVKSDNQSDYKEKYYHWHTFNGIKSIVDRHPNPTAHAIIANSITQILKPDQN